MTFGQCLLRLKYLLKLYWKYNPIKSGVLFNRLNFVLIIGTLKYMIV